MKNHHYLWGKSFSLISDCIVLRWSENYDGDNNAIRRLQLELAYHYYSINDRPCGMLADADFFSRLAQNIHIDPSMKDYIVYSRNLHNEASPPINKIIYRDGEIGRFHQYPFPLLILFMTKHRQLFWKIKI